MKKRNKNSRKKALTAVGAVVAAGLTPGFIAASAGCMPIQGHNVEVSAAEVVAIDGQAYSFDELYAMQNPDSAAVLPRRVADVSRYGTSYPTRIMHDAARRKVEIVYRHVDRMPTFPGGEAALMKYIESHIKYPAKALKKRIEGRVEVQFVVDKTGNIGEVKVVRPGDKLLDEEAVRLIKSLPKFTPGRQSGKAVPVWYTLPVTFTLPEE